MFNPLYAVVAVVLSLGSFAAGRVTAPLQVPYAPTDPVHCTAKTHSVAVHSPTISNQKSAKVTIIAGGKATQYTVPRAANRPLIHRKAHFQRPVNKAKSVKKHVLPRKLVTGKDMSGKRVHISDKRKPIVLHPKKIAADHFDCSVVPDIAYQYPRSAVIRAASEYLPKNSLLKLDYCLSRGGSG